MSRVLRRCRRMCSALRSLLCAVATSRSDMATLAWCRNRRAPSYSITISCGEEAVRTALARYAPEEAEAYEVMSSEGVDLLGEPAALRVVGGERRLHGCELLDELVFLVVQIGLHRVDLVAQAAHLAGVAVDPLGDRAAGVGLRADEAGEAVGPPAEQLLRRIGVGGDRALQHGAV